MVLQKFQRDFTDFRVQLPLVGARPRILAGLGPFVAFRASQTIRFAIEHDDQRLFHRAAYHFAQVLLNLPLINLNHLAQLRSSLWSFWSCLVLLFFLVGGPHRSSSLAFLRPSVLPTRPTPPQIYEKKSTLFW